MDNQVFNPYLPLYEYIPDGETHVFGDRVYIFGSHDRFDGGQFCLNDYVSYSADVKDLKHWRYEGVIYRADQDPVNQLPEGERIPLPEGYGFDANLNPSGIHQLWAPDVVRGTDGRYYLYYCLDFLPEVAVAVCDTPAGHYEYYGRVRHADGTTLGTREGDYEQFDPGIFRDDDGEFYLFSGNVSPNAANRWPGRKASQVMTLEPDMLTLKTEARVLLPDPFDAAGTDFEGHSFFEASSIRKIMGRYYLVYSSGNSHELCYAVSDKPDSGYRFGGTLVDIGDAYLDGSKPRIYRAGDVLPDDFAIGGDSAEKAVMPLGNTHGGLECIDGSWYVFYHRQTNRTNYSRQGCAEKVEILPDGRIPQVEITSCGLNGGPLKAEGSYPAAICSELRAAEGSCFSDQLHSDARFPYIRQLFPDVNSDASKVTCTPAQCLMNLKDGSRTGYKYFSGPYSGPLTLWARGYGSSAVHVTAAEKGSKRKADCGIIALTGTIRKEESRVLADGREFGGAPGEAFAPFGGKVEIPFETYALYFEFEGADACFDLHTFAFS